MEDVLKVIVENLVENKDAIKIVKEEQENGIIKFKVTVAQEEMGKVIGKQGKVAQSIKSLMRAVGGKEQKKVEVEFVD
jgi:predicted RNA-binding protein YlqC (UPF0109 family)